MWFHSESADLPALIEQAWRDYRAAAKSSEQRQEVESRLHEAVRGGGFPEAGYRQGALHRGALMLILVDPGADRLLRAAAATALDREGHDGTAALRVAADRMIEPGQREVLLRIADTPEEARARLLESLVDAETQAESEAEAAV